MENRNNGFFQGQVNALKDVYKNTDANEVLNKILEKIQSFEGFASGTELGDTLSGISNLAKNRACIARPCFILVLRFLTLPIMTQIAQRILNLTRISVE